MLQVLTPKHARLEGNDLPYNAETMIGHKRLQNVRECIEKVLADNIPGDLIETGVWRGGCTIFMRAVLMAYDVTDRDVYVADSFAGLPAPNIKDYPEDTTMNLHEYEMLSASQEQVMANFVRYGMLDDHVKFIKGFFSESLPPLRGHPWSLIRLDGDMYESTMVALQNLYPTLSPGGFAIIDEYSHILECRQAVDDYRWKNDITEDIYSIDSQGAFWRKKSQG
jgi:O-methyltransferase